MHHLLTALLFIWEIPQIVAGLGVLIFMKSKKRVVRIETERHHFFIETPFTGVSLGWFVFWTPDGNRYPHLVNDCRMHEYGHARQSMMLGPLYLIVVGISSLSRVFYRRWYYRKNGRSWENYFNGFPENWADKLGGVTGAKN